MADLRAALQRAVDHMAELTDAWVRGSLSEHDGRGGERSNRNEECLRAARAVLDSPQEDGWLERHCRECGARVKLCDHYIAAYEEKRLSTKPVLSSVEGSEQEGPPQRAD